MKPARLIVLGIALLAGLAAAMLASRTPEAPPPEPVAATAPIRTEDVLVAANELPLGQHLKAGDITWRAWPTDYVPSGALTRSVAPGAVEEFTGAIVRSSFLAGEPIRRERLIKADGSGFMSAILPSGMRAFAISIDTRGATSAGGFILPNDRVDVVRIGRDEEAAKAGSADVQFSETVLTNIRVLAIGQNVQERNGERVVTGETATLEVTPAQAETLALSQKTGQLTLALRSLADANRLEGPREDTDKSFTVIRYGVTRQASKR